MSSLQQECNGQTSINFIVLTMIRGTAPLMMFLAVSNLNSPGLVVALKCGITCVLFLLSGSYVCSSDAQIRMKVIKNLKTASTYWRLVVIGFLQSAAPYILSVYSLQFLPPTMIGVFMVTTPWWTMLIERLPFIRMRKRIPGMIKVGMFFGLIGTSLMLGPIIRESVHCKKFEMIMTNSSKKNITTENKENKELFDTCLSGVNLVTGVVAMGLAPILWAIASVFWKRKGHDIHYLVSSVGQNFVGACIALIIWAIAEHLNALGKREWPAEAVVGVIFLGVATGWLATLLVKFLYTTVGARTTNLVLTGIPFIAFVEDSIFVKDVIKVQPYVVAMEIIGLLLVSGGVFISNLPSSVPPDGEQRRRRSSLSDPLITENTPSEGVAAGLDQAFHNEVHQYTSLPQQEEEDDNKHRESEEEINSHVSDRTAYPKLSQVT